MNPAAPLPAQRGVLSSGQPLEYSSHLSRPEGTIAAAPLAECVLQLSSKRIRGERNVLKADLNIRGLEESEKNVLYPVTALLGNPAQLLLHHNVLLGGSLGTGPYRTYRRGTLNGHPTRSSHNATLQAVYTLVKERPLSVTNEITTIQLRIHCTRAFQGVHWETPTSRQESTDCLLKAKYSRVKMGANYLWGFCFYV